MSMTLYDVYGEGGDFVLGGYAMSTTGGYYRTGYSRAALFGGSPNTYAYRTWSCGPLASGWFSMRIYFQGSSGGSGTSQNNIGLTDSSGNIRLAMGTQTNSALSNPWTVYKVSSTGTYTSLGTTSVGFNLQPSTPDKLDIQWTYGTTGTLKIYINKVLVFSYTGDLTTSSTITGYAGSYHAVGNTFMYNAVSELVVANSDTRDLDVFTQYATGAGAEDDWTGTYTNVNAVTPNDANYDTTATSGAIQLYAQSNIGTYTSSIIGVVTNVRATAGGGSLGNLELVQTIGGSNYSSSEQSLPSAFSGLQFIQQVSPASGVAFTQSELNTSYQLGVKALT